MAEMQARVNYGEARAAASNVVTSTIESAKEMVKAFHTYILAVGAILVVVGTTAELGPTYVAASFAIGSIPLIAVFFLQTLPEHRCRRRAEELKAWAVDADESPAAYFRLVPYEEKDRSDFRRADGAHQRVVEFIRGSAGPLLYLSGVSGAGKTSLLNAYVVPELRASSPSFRVIKVRGGEHPVSSLRKALLHPGTIWKNPRNNDPDEKVIDLLGRAAAYLDRNQTRLLIVFDQFEEVIFAHDRQPHNFEDFNQFLQSLKTNSIEGVRVLFSFRDDYKGMLGELQLPVLEQGRNWLFISPFSHSAARDFLKGGFDRLGSEVLSNVLHEAEIYEDSPGQFRPITLNMIGRMLKRTPGALSAEDVDRSLEKDLRRMLQGDSQAKLVLNALISEHGKRRARTVGEVAAELKLDQLVVEGACNQLQTEGIVRRLNRTNELAERAWEVSHDFVARLLVTVLRHMPPTLWQRVRPWILPGALLVTGIATAAVLWHHYNAPKRAANRLRDEGMIVFGAADAGWTVEYRFDGRERASDWKNTLVDLKLLGPIKELTIQNPPFEDCRSLATLNDLESLRLVQVENDSNQEGSTVQLTRLAGIEQLTALKNLELRNLEEIDDFTPVGKLTGLQSLTIQGCNKMEKVPLLHAGNLTSLRIAGCDKLNDVSQIADLVSLTRLSLVGCDAVTQIPLAKLIHLDYLDLNGNDGLTTKPLDVTGLRKVALLDLNGSDDLHSIKGLGDLGALKRLNLEECKTLELAPAEVSKLTQLEVFNVNRCAAITADVIAQLPPSLTHLHICKLAVDDDAVKAILRMKSLKELSIQDTFDAETVAEIKAALPNCTINDFSKGGGD